jgi:hypothetical protein
MTWTRRRYTWRHDPDEPRDAEYLGAQAARVLSIFCASWPRYFRDPEVTGHAFGVTVFSVTVESRDQWWVAKRSRRILSAMQRFTQIPLKLVSEEEVARPEVHDHRSTEWLNIHSSKPATVTCTNGHTRPRGVKCRECATSPRKKVKTPWPAGQ